MEEIRKLENETETEYLLRLQQHRKDYGLTWDDIAKLMNAVTGNSYGESTYRKRATNLARVAAIPRSSIPNAAIPAQKEEKKEKSLDDILLEIKKQRVVARDERTQANAIIRRMSREETIIEMAKEAAQNIITNGLVLPCVNHQPAEMDRVGILQISDWHYGIDINNSQNVYNPEVARERIAYLLAEVIDIIHLHNLKKVYVMNLGDMIAGKIHLPLRVNSRFDVVTQVIEVTEILAQFLSELNQHVEIEYFDTLDNHSRIEPNLKESLDLESLCRFTTWYLKLRLAGTGIIMNDNEFGLDIITAEIMGHKVAGVHGHNDRPERIVHNVITRTKEMPDLVLAAHYHHFKGDEDAECNILFNGSLMGTDDYAQKLRLSSKASQNFIVCTPSNPVYALHKIQLN